MIEYAGFVKRRFAILGIGVAVAACAKQAPAPTSSGQANRECPGHNFRVELTDTVDGERVSRVFLEVPVAGPNSSVPEYHDCQRLATGQSPHFGPLVGVYASRILDSLFSDSTAREGWPPSEAAAQVLSLDGHYPQLHIEQNFNCLYIWKAEGKWNASMKPVGINADQCLKPLAHGDGKPLKIREITHALSGEHVPPVARWDWDTLNHHHYIGIKCGQNWCEVGNTVSSRNHEADTMPPPRPVTDKPAPPGAKRDRVVEIKGWYDEQRLAVPRPGGLVVTSLVGTLIPHPSLDEMNQVADFANWQPVATVTLSMPSPEYQDKLNLEAGTGVNLIELCAGPKSECVPTGADVSMCTLPSNGDWWARITSTSGSVAYKCVVRHVHAGSAPPATARWRWLENDETTWIRCPGGCCTLER